MLLLSTFLVSGKPFAVGELADEDSLSTPKVTKPIAKISKDPNGAYKIRTGNYHGVLAADFRDKWRRRYQNSRAAHGLNESGGGQSIDAGLFRYELNKRLSALREIRDKSFDKISEDDKDFLRNLAEQNNFALYLDYLNGRYTEQRLRDCVAGLEILISARLAALDYPDLAVLDQSAVSSIVNTMSDGNLSHELNHLFTGVVLLRELLGALIGNEAQELPVKIDETAVKASRVLRRGISVLIEKYHDDCRGWMAVLGNMENFPDLNVKMVLALLDDLRRYMKAVMAERAYIERHARGNLAAIGDVAIGDVDGMTINECLDRINIVNGECAANIRMLGELRDGLRTVDAVSIDVDASIRNAARRYIGDRVVKVQLDLDSRRAVFINGNAFDIYYMWSNLFGNAIRAVTSAKRERRRGELIVRTRIIGEDSERKIEISIQDNGIGIPEDLLKGRRLFNDGVSGELDGTGRGLYMVERTVASLGGSIDVESTIGEGTKFTLKFPMSGVTTMDGAAPMRADAATPAEFVRRETVIFYAGNLSRDLQRCEKALAEFNNGKESDASEHERLIRNLVDAIAGLKDSYDLCDEDIKRRCLYTPQTGYLVVKNEILRAARCSIDDIMRNAISVLNAGIKPMARSLEGKTSSLSISEGAAAIEGILRKIRAMLDYLRNISEVTLFKNKGRIELRIPILCEPDLYKKGEEYLQKVVTSFDPEHGYAYVAASQDATIAAEISLESERAHAANFRDQVQGQSKPIIVALGTSWIKGYREGEQQYIALNPLISGIRTYCESKGIRFIDSRDDRLLQRIEEERRDIGAQGATVIVLAGVGTVESGSFTELRAGIGNTIIGVNGEEVADNGYIRLMEMLTIALKLSADIRIDPSATSIAIDRVDNEMNNPAKGHYYRFTLPPAEPMDLRSLQRLYDMQRFA